MRMLRHDAGGGRETTLSFGVALHIYTEEAVPASVWETNGESYQRGKCNPTTHSSQGRWYSSLAIGKRLVTETET